MSDYKRVIETLPGFLKPRLRLFLSVDIVNSTAFKQKAMPTGWLRYGGSTSANPQHEGAEDWFLPIASFYHELERAFYARWHLHAAQAQKLGWHPGEPPELWKAAGDELLFCKTLSDYWQAWTCVRALIDAVNDHREALRKQFHMLDLKAAAWLAGFPVNNVEIVVLSDRAEPESDETEGDPVLANFRLLEQIYNKKKTAQLKRRYFRDFVGPSMDTGFRVAELSTARKMAISSDLALMLAFTDITLHAKTSDHGVASIEFHYDGRVPLKGVIDGAPYPFFWLDTATAESLFACEDKINGPKPVESTHAVKDFCENFLRDLGERHLPFIDGSSDTYFQPKSSFHASRLQSLSAYWQKGMDKSRQAAKAQLSDKGPDQCPEHEWTEQQRSERLNAICATAAGEKGQEKI